MSDLSTIDSVIAKATAAGEFARTRWWWIRHAPVTVDGGRIYGQKDLPCDCSDSRVFSSLATMLPRRAVWVTSNLTRTSQTAEAILEAGNFERPKTIEQDKDLAEQHLGDWQGHDRQSFLLGRKQAPDSYWYAEADEKAPNGESFVDLIDRVGSAITRLTKAHQGNDIIAVAHGGTIRAALVIALRLQARGGFAFTIDNCSLTRLDHYQSKEGAGWRVSMVNQLP